MSRLDELITELCPNGVEYKKLGEVTEMKRGTSATKKDFESGMIPVISGGKEPAFYCDRSNRDGETITVAGSGAGAGYVQYWNIPVFVNDAFSIKGNDKLLTKYIFYYLCNIQDKIYATKKGGGVPHVHISSIENFLIPVPPTDVQREIVRILDTFTNLTQELTQELTLRQKQYEYYRAKLLDFGTVYGGTSECEQHTLEEICNISAGGDVPKENFSQNKTNVYNIPIISNGIGESAFYGYTDITKISVPAVTVSARGTIGYAEYRDYPYYPIVRLLSVIPENTDLLNTKFLYYVLKKQNYNVSKTGIPQLTAPMIKKISIPLPPIEEQERIVAILDRFDKLCNDLTSGLPAEINARQKQYEYYRDKLLSFS